MWLKSDGAAGLRQHNAMFARVHAHTALLAILNLRNNALWQLARMRQAQVWVHAFHLGPIKLNCKKDFAGLQACKVCKA